MTYYSTTKALSDLELLREVRRILTSPSRWVQGNLERRGQVCLVGAGILASFGFLDNMAAAILGTRRRLDTLLLPIIWDQHGQMFADVEKFNDCRDIRHEDILAVLDKKITQLEEQA